MTTMLYIVHSVNKSDTGSKNLSFSGKAGSALVLPRGRSAVAVAPGKQPGARLQLRAQKMCHTVVKLYVYGRFTMMLLIPK